MKFNAAKRLLHLLKISFLLGLFVFVRSLLLNSQAQWRRQKFFKVGGRTKKKKNFGSYMLKSKLNLGYHEDAMFFAKIREKTKAKVFGTKVTL